MPNTEYRGPYNHSRLVFQRPNCVQDLAETYYDRLVFDDYVSHDLGARDNIVLLKLVDLIKQQI